MRYNSFMNQVTIGYTDMYSAKAVKLFPNGSIQIAGCSNILDCKRVIKQTELVLSFVFQKKLSLPYQQVPRGHDQHQLFHELPPQPLQSCMICSRATPSSRRRTSPPWLLSSSSSLFPSQA